MRRLVMSIAAAGTLAGCSTASQDVWEGASIQVGAARCQETVPRPDAPRGAGVNVDLDGGGLDRLAVYGPAGGGRTVVGEMQRCQPLMDAALALARAEAAKTNAEAAEAAAAARLAAARAAAEEAALAADTEGLEGDW